ncbi:MAG TPA: hypothetical protein VIF15_18985 [Polyangiaceae bacterium]|jgi:hypothetical protein
MPRDLALLLVVAGVAGGGCAAFDFPRPGEGGDASPGDATTTVDASDAGVAASYLGTGDAAKACAWLFRCPRLAEAIELSLVLPVNTPSTPLGFSSCMDWVAGPVDPSRLGLATQQGILKGVAQAASCADAYAAVPIHPVDAGGTCAATRCADGTDLESCTADAGAFTAACAPPLFGATGACIADDAGVATCVSLGKCPPALSCDPSGALVDCIGGAAFVSYDCSLSGRQCLKQGANLAHCVAPGTVVAPCPLDNAADRCDHDFVLHCAGGPTAQTEFDCAAVGRTCTSSNPAGVARCAHATGDACTPFDAAQNQCSGSTISVCVGGSSQSFDCASVGMTCVAADATHTAHCG